MRRQVRTRERDGMLKIATDRRDVQAVGSRLTRRHTLRRRRRSELKRNNGEGEDPTRNGRATLIAARDTYAVVSRRSRRSHSNRSIKLYSTRATHGDRPCWIQSAGRARDRAHIAG